jgi:hypothetical protein
MRRHFFLVILALIGAGCASTTLTNSWRAPDYSGAVRSLVVVGVSKQASVRRVFEDEFAAQLDLRGVRAVPSYTLVPEDGPIDKDMLRSAVDSTDADAVIITRLIRVENKVTVSQPGPPLATRYDPYYYGFYSRAWIGYYEPPVVHQYDVVTAETTVFVKDRAEPVWSGTTETFAPSDLKKETTGFAKVVIEALAKEELI